ncbi:MAG: SIR2 family protein [Flavobacteriales bacterium]|nr:SIR2 family protein [Flavobacteriales bacterium]
MDRKRFIDKAASELQIGSLGLMVGAGLSMSVGLPSWQKLVSDCCATQLVDPPKDNSGKELKLAASRLKASFAGQPEYIQSVAQHLYKGSKLSLALIRQRLLMAVASIIIVQSKLGSPQVLSLNFDSVLEWYLKVNALKVEVISNVNKLSVNHDVQIMHPHGYLPHPNLPGASISPSMVLGWEEFAAFFVESSVWKERVLEFLRSKVFLAVGVGIGTLREDMDMFIGSIANNDKDRRVPYGLAILPEKECPPEVQEELLGLGVIVHTVKSYKEIPQILFAISQKSINQEVPLKLS